MKRFYDLSGIRTKKPPRFPSAVSNQTYFRIWPLHSDEVALAYLPLGWQTFYGCSCGKQNWFLHNGFIHSELPTFVDWQPCSCRYQATHNNVFFEATEVIHSSRDTGFGENLCGLLERCRTDKALGAQRRF